MTTSDVWPVLRVEDWTPTRETVHLWTQIVGKLRMALSPRINHWWGSTLYVTARGLTTSVMPVEHGGLEVQFDFVDHECRLLHTDGRSLAVELRPRSVADFYTAFTAALTELGVRAPIHPVPVELPEVIPFPDDDVHASYDGPAIRAFWLSLVAAQHVLGEFRAGFRGKASPVHFFWGAFDLATTRFSGRPAPLHPGGVPNCPDSVMHEAYNAELSSAGFWPGGGAEGGFYSYTYPEPPGFRDVVIDVPGARFDEQLGEFVLPYEDVRTAADPASALLGFLEQTFQAGAEHGNWPR